MAISGKKYTRLTNELEKSLVKLGGYDPDKALTTDELVDALVKAIEVIADHKPEQIEAIFRIVTERLDKDKDANAIPPTEGDKNPES